MTECRLVMQRAELADAKALGELGRVLYRHYYAHLWTAAGCQAFIDEQFGEHAICRQLSRADTAYFFIMVDEVLAGFAKTRLSQCIPGLPEIGMLIDKIYFKTEHISKGLGQVALDHLQADARRAGETLVWLVVLKSNLQAQRAYEKAGFHIVGQAPFSTDIADIGFFVMSRRLEGRRSIKKA